MRTSSARIPGAGRSFLAAVMITAAACVAPPAQPARSAESPPSQAAAAAGPQCRHEFAVTTTQDRATVCKVGNCSLREAVMAANACPGRNLIDVPAGRYKLTLGNNLGITEEVTIIGAGRDTTVVEDVSGWGAFAVQHDGGIDHLSVIRQMTVEKSKLVPCILVGREVSLDTPPPETALLLSEARLQNCASRQYGGGMRIFRGGYGWLIDVDVFGNHALLGGGIANTEGKLEVWQSRFSNNAATQGGAVYSKGPYSPPQPASGDDRVIIRDSSFSNNNAVIGPGYMSQGGALHVEWQAVRVTKTRFELNAAEHWGGAISLMGTGPATLEDVEMTKNRARLGAGGLLADMDLKASKITAIGNQALGGDGGGLYLGSDFDVSDALIRENVAETRQTATGAFTGGRGGGVAVMHGGGTMRNATITANLAREGGGYYNYGFSALSNVTLSMNAASQSGGGARNYTGEMWIKNATIFDNNAPEASALSSFSSYPLLVGPDFPRTYINHTILAGGTAGQAACRDDHFILTGGTDRGLISKGRNLPSDPSCGTIQNTDLPPASPQLGPLANNGGFAPTHRPSPGSPALDRGANSSDPYYNQNGCAPQDARGVARPQASVLGGQVRCDIGALELTPFE